MRVGRLLGAILALVGLALAVQGPQAHPGGLDSRGGHYNRKTGEYHIHRPSGEQATPRRSPAASGLATDGSFASPGAVRLPGSLRDLGADRKVDALIAVLLRRGLVTEAELVAELAR